MFSIFRFCSKNITSKPGVSFFSETVSLPLRSSKPKSRKNKAQYFVDLRRVRTIGGNGGDGCISFLHLWCNEHAGPDGADGGNGGHVIFQTSTDVTDLKHVPAIISGNPGERGSNKDCHGKNAEHIVIKVPLGTIIKHQDGKIVGDLVEEGTMFVAARGGAGGKGNHFFISDIVQAPEVCEYGADGEDHQYSIEVRCMANIGLIGFPNAGKSTLLRAISRARPKVAPYPFTTLSPHVGVIQYEDYEQVAVADLPGLIPGSHNNKGLGIQFLKHAERCTALLFVLDLSYEQPWEHLDCLQYELSQFCEAITQRTQLVVANKLDLPGAHDNLKLLVQHTSLPVVAISAKMGTNLSSLLRNIKEIYDRNVAENT